MIGQIKGKITYKENGRLIIDTGGVGYKIHPSKELYDRVEEDERVSVWTHLAVRENALDLYGFETKEDLNFFELLITVSGIGPKSAISIMDTASLDLLKRSISSGKTSSLTEVAGIGKKNAEKIVLELKNKMGSCEYGEGGDLDDSDLEVYEALTNLGYSVKEARSTVIKISKDGGTTEKRIKEALKILGK